MPLAHGRFFFFLFERPPYLTESRKKTYNIFFNRFQKYCYTCTHTHTQMHTHVHVHVQILTYTYTHTRAHTLVHTHSYTTRTHTRPCTSQLCSKLFKCLTLTPPYRSIFPLSPMILTSFIRDENFIEWAEFRTFILVFLAWRRGYFKQAWSTPVSMRQITSKR